MMIKTKNDLKQYLLEDAKFVGFWKPSLKDWLFHNEYWYIYHFIRHLRYVEYYINSGKNRHPMFFWHWLRYKRLGFKLHYTIYPNTVGAGFRMFHSGGYVHVGPQTHIGKNCTLMPGVVFGNKNQDCKWQEITVGDNCYFGLDSKIFGPVHIGNNVVVGANSVVTKDVPDNAVIGGIPAKIIRFQFV